MIYFDVFFSGLVKHVRVGEVDYSTNDECTHCQDFSVADRIVYPGYNFSCKYHDIALLKLDRPALITDYVEPACLHTGETIDFSSSVTVAGWGATGYAQRSSRLQHATIMLFSNRDCNKAYQNNPKIPKGVLDQYQICAGTHTGDKDTCRVCYCFFNVCCDQYTKIGDVYRVILEDRCY